MDVKQIEKKFNTISVTSDQLNKNLESLRKKTINLSITSQLTHDGKAGVSY